MIIDVVFAGLFLSIVAAIGAYTALRLDARKHRRRRTELEHLVDIQREQVMELQTRIILLLSDFTMMKNELDKDREAMRAAADPDREAMRDKFKP